MPFVSQGVMASAGICDKMKSASEYPNVVKFDSLDGDVAAGLLAAVVRAGGSRQVVVAAATALWRAATAAGGGQEAAACVAGAGDHRWLLEHLLAAVAEAVAAPGKFSIPALKSMLRGAGHAELASRRGRFSKLRNGVAHPDVGLAAAIRQALGGVNVPPARQ